MADLGSYFSEIPEKASNYFGSQRGFADMGRAASAMMAGYDSPKADMLNALGQLGTGMATSTIASDKASEQEAQQAQMRKILMSYLGMGEGSKNPLISQLASNAPGTGMKPVSGVGPGAGPPIRGGFRLNDPGPTSSLTPEHLKGATKRTKTRTYKDDGSYVDVINETGRDKDDPKLVKQDSPTDIFPF